MHSDPAPHWRWYDTGGFRMPGKMMCALARENE